MNNAKNSYSSIIEITCIETIIRTYVHISVDNVDNVDLKSVKDAK